VSPRAITRSNARSSNMTAATQGVLSSEDRLTDGTPLWEVLDVATGHRTQPVYHGDESDEDVPNWHTLRSLGSIWAELADDLERKSRSVGSQ
jgi:hypothetical protein